MAEGELLDKAPAEGMDVLQPASTRVCSLTENQIEYTL